MADLKIPAPAVTAAAFPRGVPVLVLVKGPDLYCANLRQGAAVTVVTADADLPATIHAAPGIGPLANHFNPQMYGQPQHYATKAGADPLAAFDALEGTYPKDRAALDPRTIYSAVSVVVPGEATV